MLIIITLPSLAPCCVKNSGLGRRIVGDQRQGSSHDRARIKAVIESKLPQVAVLLRSQARNVSDPLRSGWDVYWHADLTGYSGWPQGRLKAGTALACTSVAH